MFRSFEPDDAAYDPVSRLASLTQNLAGSANDLVIDQIAYNPASQIVGQRRSPDAYAWTGHTDGTIPTTPNGLNQIATRDATAYTYDDNGNLISDGTWTYNYDTENRLKTAQSAAGGVNLFYDPLGRLWQVSGDPVVDTQFVNDGIHLALEYRISSGAVERRYVHGPGWDEPLIQYDGAGLATKRHLHADERGSVIALTDATGANPAINRYDEFGIPQNTNSGRFGYTGQAWLKEIGLNYYKTRMYRPGDGVFLQPDPIGYVGGMNLYAYVGNDPVNSVDPLGLDDEDRPPIIVVGTGIPINLLGSSAIYAGNQNQSLRTVDPRTLPNEKIEEIVVTYWRGQRNNPLSSIGTNIGFSGEGFLTGWSRTHLMANILNTPVLSDNRRRYPTLREAERIYQLIRWNLMIADINARASDQSGVRGLLSAGQIFDYHVDVFGSFGLDSSAFSGDFIFGSRTVSRFTGSVIWCRSCDR